MAIFTVLVGAAAIAAGIFGKHFHSADVASGLPFKQKSSTWSGRLIFIVVGIAFVAAGIKQLMDGE